MSNFVKKNENIANYFISKELIPFETDKASFINLPNHNRHIGFWLSNVVYHTHFVDFKKIRKNNKIYNLKYKNIIKNDIYK